MTEPRPLPPGPVIAFYGDDFRIGIVKDKFAVYEIDTDDEVTRGTYDELVAFYNDNYEKVAE